MNLKSFNNIKISSVLLFLSFILFGCVNDAEIIPTIEKGKLDLSNWDFKQKPEITLQGETLFYWKQLPINNSGIFNVSKLKSESKILWPPALWTSNENESKGYGTFRFLLNQADLKEPLVLNFDRVLGAVEIWINGKKQKQFGTISEDGISEIIDGRPLRFELPLESELDIMLVVSNHNNRLGGGFPLQNRLQTKSHYESVYPIKSIVEGLITLLIVLFGCYQIYRFYAFKAHKHFLYFGLFCLIGASRQFFVGENLIYYIFSDISFAIVQKMRYIGYFGGLSVIFLYHNALFPKYFSKRVSQIAVIVPLLGVLYVLLATTYYATLIAPFFQVFGLLIVLLGFYQIFRAIRDKKTYAKWVLVSLIVTSGTFINDILNAMLIIQTAYVVNYGVLFYVIFQVYLNHKIQAEKEKLLISLATNVEKLEANVNSKIGEIEKLRVETFQHLKSKEVLVDNLNKIKSNDSSVSITSIIANLKSELLEDSQLSVLKNDIESLHYKFTERIQERHPNLTKTDLEICTYLRMSLSRKEIARLRFTSTDAVKKSRNRLRKKMTLSEDVDLETYLKNI